MKREEARMIADELAKAIAPFNEEFFSAKQLAEFLKVSESYIRHNKELPCVKIGGSIRYPKSKVVKFVCNI